MGYKGKNKQTNKYLPRRSFEQLGSWALVKWMQPTNNGKSVGETIKMHYIPNLPCICRTFISHSPTAHMASSWQNSNCTLTPLELCLIWQTFTKPVTHGFQATLHQWFSEKGITVWKIWQRLTFWMSLFVDKNSFNAFLPVQRQILLCTVFKFDLLLGWGVLLVAFC